jgi:hypothetical protein
VGRKVKWSLVWVLLEPEEVQHASRDADSACPFCIDVMAKMVTLSQHSVTCVVPPLGKNGAFK